MFDSFGRNIHYLRVSVTDRCNLRCTYCMPEEGVPFVAHERILSLEQIALVVRAAAGLGFDKVRLTGGEPLVRKGMPDLVSMLAAIPGIATLGMTTNGTLLAPVAAELQTPRPVQRQRLAGHPRSRRATPRSPGAATSATRSPASARRARGLSRQAQRRPRTTGDDPADLERPSPRFAGRRGLRGPDDTPLPPRRGQVRRRPLRAALALRRCATGSACWRPASSSPACTATLAVPVDWDDIEGSIRACVGAEAGVRQPRQRPPRERDRRIDGDGNRTHPYRRLGQGIDGRRLGQAARQADGPRGLLDRHGARDRWRLVRANGMAKGDVLAAAPHRRHHGRQEDGGADTAVPQHRDRPRGRRLHRRDDRIDIESLAVCTDKTGIEMEALTAASVAALTIWDMCKAVDKSMRIDGPDPA